MNNIPLECNLNEVLDEARKAIDELEDPDSPKDDWYPGKTEDENSQEAPPPKSEETKPTSEKTSEKSTPKLTDSQPPIDEPLPQPPEQTGDVYFGKRGFNPTFMRDAILRDFDIINVEGNLYIYKNGVYKPKALPLIRREVQKRLGAESRPNRTKTTITEIEDATFTKQSEINPNKYLINLKNCMYDLKKFEPIEHDPKYLSTTQIPVEYDKDVKGDKVWKFFTSTIPNPFYKTILYLFGYALTQFMFVQRAVVLKGDGGNGKTTFLNLLTRFIGEQNISNISLQQLTENRFAGASLFGKIVNIFDDLEEKAIEDTSMFKIVTGRGRLRAEEKYMAPFYFYPKTKFFFSANTMPKSTDRSYAYYRRLLIIPFTNTFKGDNEDPDMLQKITTPNELSALLNGALLHLKLLLDHKEMPIPQEAKDELDEYKALNDNVMAYISDACEFGDDFYIIRSKFFEDYKLYCEDMDFRNVSKRRFYREIRDLDDVVDKRKRIEGEEERIFVGIRPMKSTLF